MILGYAYPWDFSGDPAAATRAAELGCDTVVLAATYHASRTVSPLHPTRRVVEVPVSAVYLPLRPEAWRGRRLAPSGPGAPGGVAAFGEARSALDAAGLDTAAWIVVTHHDELGRANPDLVVRNAFGDPYSYALCPSSPEVREYAATLVTEVVATSEVDRVVLEACGPMGLAHGGVHDKVEFANLAGVAVDLLSICFCASCATRFAARGLDADELARDVRGAFASAVPSVGEALGEDVARAVRDTRAELAADLQLAVLDALAPTVTVTIHGSATPGATGSFPEVGAAVLGRVGAVVANAWHESSAASEIAGLARLMGEGAHLGAYLRLDRGWDDAAIGARVAQYASAGVDEWHLYHLGLLSADGLEVARRLIEAVHDRDKS